MGLKNLREAGDRDLLIAEWIDYANSADERHFWACEALAEVIDEDPRLRGQLFWNSSIVPRLGPHSTSRRLARLRIS